jgi:hypothetical protein
MWFIFKLCILFFFLSITNLNYFFIGLILIKIGFIFFL